MRGPRLLALLLSASFPLRAELPVRMQPYVDVTVPAAPVPFQQSGVWKLAYELDLRSSEWHDLVLLSIEVLGEPGEASLLKLEGDALRAALWRPGFPRSPQEAAFFRDPTRLPPEKAPPPFPDPIPQPERIGPGLSALLFVWLELPKGPLPRALRHRVAFDALHARVAGRPVLTTPQVAVEARAPIVLDPPVRGGPWRITNGPAPGSPHRTGMIFLNGRRGHPQRFALDLVKVNAQGLTQPGGASAARDSGSPGKAPDPKDSFSYGEPVFAGGEGEVIEAVDGMPDNRSTGFGETAIPMTTENIAGNRVCLKLGADAYVLYAHLAPGSVRVKPGQRVRPGEILGAVGNSGSALGTHLHLQVSTGPGMSGDGLPFALRATEVGSGKEWIELQGVPFVGNVLRFGTREGSGGDGPPRREK